MTDGLPPRAEGEEEGVADRLGGGALDRFGAPAPLESAWMVQIDVPHPTVATIQSDLPPERPHEFDGLVSVMARVVVH